MANYTRNAEKAVAEAFNGTQDTADTLIAAYPDIISLQKEEGTYPVKSGANTFGAASTGVTATMATTEPGTEYVAAVVTLTVTHACTTSGDVSVKVLGGTAVPIAVLDTDDTAAKVATKIRAGTFTGWTLSGSDNIVIFTLDAVGQTDAVLFVLNEKGSYLNAYKDTYIVFTSGYRIPDTTTIWDKTDFEKYWTVAGA